LTVVFPHKASDAKFSRDGDKAKSSSLLPRMQSIRNKKRKKNNECKLAWPAAVMTQFAKLGNLAVEAVCVAGGGDDACLTERVSEEEIRRTKPHPSHPWKTYQNNYPLFPIDFLVTFTRLCSFNVQKRALPL
jgi:hypothetical protein